MDKLILGLLMLQKLTAYEIRGIIRKNFRDICSDSMGAIQFALKKLLQAEMITCSEYVEKSVNKKQYAITTEGRQAFLAWLQVPADFSGTSNMELGKLLFMGILPPATWGPQIDETIAKLEASLASLLEVRAQIQPSAYIDAKKQTLDHWNRDRGYFSDVIDKFDQITFFQKMTLQYGIDSMQFELEWFRKLKEDIKKFEEETK